MVLKVVNCDYGLHETSCPKCGFKIRAYLACNDKGVEMGFKLKAMIKCPICGEDVTISHIYSDLIKPIKQKLDMITEDFVSFETAKLLKEKGFDETVRCFYDIQTEILCDNCVKTKNSYTESIAAPTLQMALKWLREVHTIIIELHHQHRKEWYAIVSSENPLGIGVYTTSTLNTYEQAAEAAIKYCLENLI